MKKKALFIALAAVGLLAALFGVANAKDKAPALTPEPGPEDEDDIEVNDNETIVIPPGATGMPDGSSVPIIVRDEDELTIEPKPKPGKEPLPISSLPTNEEVEAVADAVGVPVPDVVKDIVKDVVPENPLPIAIAETSPEADPNGTISLARAMLTRENLPNWKEDLQQSIKEWQEGVGLKPDGKFGMKSAARMAEEVGILPLVRFWTAGIVWNKASAKKEYEKVMRPVIDGLRADLPESQAHINALEKSLAREQAQSLSANPKPVATEKWVKSAIESSTNAAMKDLIS